MSGTKGIEMSNKIPESAWGDLIARRANNESVSSIARRYGCSPATVYSDTNKGAISDLGK